MVEFHSYTYGEGGCHINCPASTQSPWNPQNCLYFLFFFFFFNVKDGQVQLEVSFLLFVMRKIPRQLCLLFMQTQEGTSDTGQPGISLPHRQAKKPKGYRQGNVSGFGWLLTSRCCFCLHLHGLWHSEVFGIEPEDWGPCWSFFLKKNQTQVRVI